jgi:hypothetical protein
MSPQDIILVAKYGPDDVAVWRLVAGAAERGDVG